MKPVNLIIYHAGLRNRPHRCDSARALVVNVPFALEENPPVVLLAVVAGQYPGTLAKSRTDTCKRVAVRDGEIEFATCDPMRNRREYCAGECFAGRRRGRLCV